MYIYIYIYVYILFAIPNIMNREMSVRVCMCVRVYTWKESIYSQLLCVCVCVCVCGEVCGVREII